MKRSPLPKHPLLLAGLLACMSPAWGAADIAITVADSPDPIAPGSALTYTISVSNAGPDPASLLQWTTTLPGGITFDSLITPGGWSCLTPPVGTTGGVSCSISPLSNGSTASFTLNVTVGAGVPDGPVSMTASLSSATADDAPGDNSATASTSVDATPPDTTINTHPSVLANSSSASFTFSAVDSGSGVASYDCQLDGSAYAACTSPQTYAGLADGPHSFAVRAIDAVGHTDLTPATYTWTVDTTPPPAPTVVTPANGSITNNTQPPVTGTAEANSTASVFIDSINVGNVTADASGNWSFTPSSPLTDGPHTVRATAIDAADNTSPSSTTFTFTVDSSAPAAPNIASISQDTGAAGDRITHDNTLVLSGSAEPGSTVTLTRAGVGVMGTAIANGAGSWNYDYSAITLTDGNHSFTATASDPTGNTSPASGPFVVHVDTQPPAPPVVLTPTDGASLNESPPAFSGTGEAGATLTIYVDGAVAGSTVADGGGNWSYAPATPLAPGSHTVRAQATDVAGNTGADGASIRFSIGALASLAPVPGLTFPALLVLAASVAGMAGRVSRRR